MLQPTPVPAPSFVERLRSGAGQRTLALCLALLAEALLLLLLLSLGTADPPKGEATDITVVNLESSDVAADTPEPSESPEPEREAEERPVSSPPVPAEPPPPRPAEPTAAPPARFIVPTPRAEPVPAEVYPRPIQPVSPGRSVSGPPNSRRASSGDTARVGTAPNGEPMFAAAWYREPAEDELRGYLSTASGPGWGLIACRTAPDYRVEDCVGLAEYPQGSQINRAVLAAAWQFKVRPPRIGGRPQVGSWVRIRIEMTVDRR